LIHVIDISDSKWQETIKAVNSILTDLGISDQVKIIQVFNKIDKRNGLRAKMDYKYRKVWLSAQTNQGLDFLLEAITVQLFGLLAEEEIVVGFDNPKLRSALYQSKAVIDETVDASGNWLMKVRLSNQEKEKMTQYIPNKSPSAVITLSPSTTERDSKK
jgi:GTP-binding protein HflX